MALIYSKRAINLNAGLKPSVTDGGSQISFTAPNLINTTQGDFISQGFRPGRAIEIIDGGASTNAGLQKIVSLTSGVITVEGAGILTEAAAVDTPTIDQLDSASWVNMFQYGVFAIFGSPIPADINGAEGASLLALLTLDGGTVVPGLSTNGLEFEFGSLGQIGIKAGQTWKALLGTAEDTAYWGMLYDNGYITGDDSVNLLSPRIMGSVGTDSSADIVLSSRSIKTTIPVICQQFDLSLPEQACS